ncbi:ras-related protein Rab-26 isoform X1 [Aphelocoma coerulescens]|uniref:ras-related protein Rab-26 isoform X1 n=1 Tax=Aphelocoma coerulescens TaxID=39617 RepID=UPI003604861C
MEALAFPALPAQHHHGNDPGEGSARVCGINAVTGEELPHHGHEPPGCDVCQACWGSCPTPGLRLLLIGTEPGLAPVLGTSPWGEPAVSTVFPTLEQLPVNDLFPCKAKCRRLLKASGELKPVWRVQTPLNKVLTVDGVKVKLQIWDTAGQERFRSVTHAYYRDAHALLLLYDVTNKASFDNIQAWLTEIHEYAQQDVVLMLLGNKVDSAQDRVVKREDGEKLAKEYGVPFMETSAKSGLNVELAFTAIAKELKHRSMKLPNEPKFKLHDYVKKEVRGSGCCRS